MTEKPVEEKVKVKTSRQEAMEAIEGDIDPKPDETVVKEGEQTAPEESTPSEQAEMEEKPQETQDPDTPEHKVSDEDLEEQLEDRKTRAQKRIDSLVAQRNAAKDEVEELKSRLEALENKSKPEEFKVYEMSQLKSALVKARDEGDIDLELEIQDQIARQRVYEAEQKYVKQDETKNDFTKRENALWAEYVSNDTHADDVDLTVNSKDSLAVRWAGKLFQENSAYYNKFGEYRLIQAVNDARDMILKSRYSKATDKKTKSLQKQLVKEKMKTQLGAPTGEGSKEEKPEPKGTFEEAIAERKNVFNRAGRM